MVRRVISPDLVETVKAFGREGNILERARQFLGQNEPRLLDTTTDSEPQEDDSAREGSEAEMPKLRTKPREWSAQRWQAIMAQFPSKALAARKIGIDVKTISAHLKRLGIEERWTGRKR